MTLHIFFLTIIIKRRKLTTEEVLHAQEVNKLIEENKDRQMMLYNRF